MLGIVPQGTPGARFQRQARKTRGIGFVTIGGAGKWPDGLQAGSLTRIGPARTRDGSLAFTPKARIGLGWVPPAEVPGPEGETPRKLFEVRFG